MSNARMSILGLYNYDPSIFDDVNWPGTIDPLLPDEDQVAGAIDKQTIIDKILMDNAELSVVYANPYTMKEMLRVWSAINQQTWKRIWDALTAEYNPIHNYDRNEEWTDDGSATTGVVGYNSDKFNDANKVVSGNTRKGRAYGNIGVTTSSQMVNEEVDLRTNRNYVQILSDMFRSEFCVMVY